MLFGQKIYLFDFVAGLYFEGTCDVILVTMATHKVHKNVH